MARDDRGGDAMNTVSERIRSMGPRFAGNRRIVIPTTKPTTNSTKMPTRIPGAPVSIRVVPAAAMIIRRSKSTEVMSNTTLADSPTGWRA